MSDEQQDRVEVVLGAWLAQMRESDIIRRAIHEGRKFDVTLYAHRGEAVREPEITVRPSR